MLSRKGVAVLVALVVLLAVTASVAQAQSLATNQGVSLVRIYNDLDREGFQVNVNGQDVVFHQVVGGYQDACISPDGRSIAILASDMLLVLDIRNWRVRERAHGLNQPAALSWSWDSRKVIFAQIVSVWDDFGDHPVYKLFRVAAYGGNTNIERIPTIPGRGDQLDSAAGPGFIVYEVWYFATTLWRYDEATGENRPLVPGNQDEVFLDSGYWGSPTVSPDGTTVAFAHWVEAANADWLYTIGSDDRGEGNLLYGLNVQEPFWLSDGTIDAVHPEPWVDGDGLWHYDEALVNLAGDGTSIVTVLAKAEPGIAHPSGAYVRRNLRLVR